MTKKTLKASYASTFWILQALTGLLLIVLLGLHIIANHFIVSGGLRDYEQVLNYIKNPVIVILEVLFVFVVGAHALIGVKSIILDLDPSVKQEKVVNLLLVVIYIATCVYGVFLATTLFFH